MFSLCRQPVIAHFVVFIPPDFATHRVRCLTFIHVILSLGETYSALTPIKVQLNPERTVPPQITK